MALVDMTVIKFHKIAYFFKIKTVQRCDNVTIFIFSPVLLATSDDWMFFKANAISYVKIILVGKFVSSTRYNSHDAKNLTL